MTCIEKEWTLWNFVGDILLYSCSTVIKKSRDIRHASGKIIEVDTFHNLKTPLIMAEVELESKTEKFEQPYWFGKEVTTDKRYSDTNLINEVI